MKKTIRFPIKRITLCAVLVALYIGLSLFSFIIGGVKVTIEGLPVIICAVAFGPTDAVIVGFLGEFLNQMLTYGFTPTTLLWVLPAVSRALVVGLYVRALRTRIPTEKLLRGRYAILLFAICAVSGIVASCFNTLAYYVDSKMFGYYNYTLVLGVFWIRVIVGAVASSAMAAVTIPITLALRRAKLID